MPKLFSLSFITLLIVAIFLIDCDEELYWHRQKLQVWRDYVIKWNNLPAFGPDGRWNVERNFDHNAHWKWQMEELRRICAQETTDKEEL